MINTKLEQGLLPWARTQSGRYEYLRTDACAFAQYLHAMGYPDANVGGVMYDLGGKEHFEFSQRMADALVSSNTFEALVARLEA
jgi:hypothetical protein